MNEGRIIAVGDIHGCSVALATLIEAIQPTALDTLVFLGDYIDRGAVSQCAHQHFRSGRKSRISGRQ